MLNPRFPPSSAKLDVGGWSAEVKKKILYIYIYVYMHTQSEKQGCTQRVTAQK